MPRSRSKITGYIKKGKITPEYESWRHMKSRCDNPNNPSYHNYGGRGIDYHPDWEYFENFIADMGVCPPGYTIDRIDNDGNYTPDNCRWASRAEQTRNASYNNVFSADGRSQIQQDWANELGVSWQFLYYRLNIKGQTMQEIYDELKGESPSANSMTRLKGAKNVLR